MCLNMQVCSACIHSYYLSLTSTCESLCQPRYHQDTQTYVCTQCPYDCYNCDELGRCTSCDSATDNRVFDNSTYRCVAMPGYYDNRSQICPQCPSSCSLCLNPNFCFQCNDGFYLYNFACDILCPDRYFSMNGSNTCEDCPYDCLRCTNVGLCTSCSASSDFRYLDNSTSRCLPLEGYYDNNTTICEPCPTGCKSCQSLELCYECVNGYYLNANNLCFTTCPARFFKSSSTNRCLRCSYDCY